MAQNLLDESYRKEILAEILGPDNQARKAESFEHSEVYNKRAQPYIDEKLALEFPETHKAMRKLYSINIAERTTNMLASVYERAPERKFHDESGKLLSDEQVAYIIELYDRGQFNTRLQWSNRVKRFQNQGIVQVIPLRGLMGMRVFQPHQIDCIPLESDPEIAFGYVTSVYDRSLSLSTGDGKNQKIADTNDGANPKLEKMRFVWWSAEHNFITNGYGEIVSGPEVLNPIQRLPFVDISDMKDNEYWVRKGSGPCKFAVEFAVMLSDLANIARQQGYAQGVIRDFEKPSHIRVGPEQWLFQELRPGDGPQPTADFISASPDINAGLAMLDRFLSYYLSCEGVDPKAVSSSGDGQKFSSALERFLSQVEAFAPSKQDIECFRWAESEVFELVVAWSNHFAGATNSPIKVKKQAALPAGAYVQVHFKEPELIQSPTEKEETEKRRIEMGISSKVMAVMNLYSLDEDGAIAHLKKVEQHNALIDPPEKEPIITMADAVGEVVEADEAPEDEIEEELDEDEAA